MPMAPSSTKPPARASLSPWPTRSAGCSPPAARFSICCNSKPKAPPTPPSPKAFPGLLAFLTDLCHVQSARSAGEVGRVCAELVFGYNRHPAWDTEGCATCYQAGDLDAMESLIPGMASLARGYTDVIEQDGAHPPKAGPCARFEGLDQFSRLRARMDGCLTGSQLAKDRAADALTKVMIPEALDYPA